MGGKHWIEYLSAIGSIATPILVIMLSAIGWKLRKSFERQKDLEDKLRDDRIEIYNQILEPFIILLMTDKAWESDKKYKNKDKNTYATTQMLSLEYRRQGFKMSLMGSDSVVKSYNNLMQYFYNHSETEDQSDSSSLKEILRLLGEFLLEIRKSMGNETSKLTAQDMLEWWMKDIRNI